MNKRVFILLGFLVVVIFGGLGYALWQNMRQQNATEKRLAELQRQVEAAARSATSSASKPFQFGSPAAPVFPAGTETQNMTVLQKQRDVRAVMDEGWKLINERNPEAAAQAALIFRDALEKVDPQYAQFYNGLGRALLIAGQSRKAIAAWQEGLALDPKISDMQSGIGWAFWNQRDYYHAKIAWEQALAVNPKSLDAWTAMVWIYLALGDTEKSKAGFQVLYASDRQNKSWILGLQMAQAKNTDPAQIGKFFPLPPLTAFAAPPVGDSHLRP